jgi:hypothetical protein
VQHLVNVEVGQAIVERGPETRDVGRPESTQTAAIQEVESIRQRLGDCVGEEERKAVRELLFDPGLQAVVVADADRLLVASAGGEVWERDRSWSSVGGVCTLRQNGGHIVVSHTDLQILGLGEDIRHLR